MRNCPFCNAPPIDYERSPEVVREIFSCYTTIDPIDGLALRHIGVHRSKTCLAREANMTKELKDYMRETMIIGWQTIGWHRMTCQNGIDWPTPEVNEEDKANRKRNRTIRMLMNLDGKRPSDNWAVPSRYELGEEIRMLKDENVKLQDSFDEVAGHYHKARARIALLELQLNESPIAKQNSERGCVIKVQKKTIDNLRATVRRLQAYIIAED